MQQALLDTDVASFCLERSFPDYFLLAWCKKSPPDANFVRDYAAFVDSARLVARAPSQDNADWEPLGPLLSTADGLGHVLLYRHQGFLHNCRQLRAAGLAAVELAQKLLSLVTA